VPEHFFNEINDLKQTGGRRLSGFADSFQGSGRKYQGDHGPGLSARADKLRPGTCDYLLPRLNAQIHGRVLRRFARLCPLLGLAGRGSPGMRLTFFASPKKVSKKGRPAVWVPTLRFGQPAVLDYGGVSRKLACGSNKRDP
jgi:hypothetical protein